MGLKFNPFTGKLDFTGSASGGGSPTGAAGGDLAGTYPNPTVDGLQGRPVSNATPYNGQVLQYDGANWVPGSIPSGGSGGGGVVYFLNFNTAADAPVTSIPQTPNASKELGIVGDVTGTSYLSPILSTASYDFLASFVTDVSTPSATAIPAGIWDFNIFAQSTTTNAANQVYFKVEIRKYDGVNAPTLLATSNDTYIYDPSEITQHTASVVMPQTTILATDRIVVYLYGRAHQNNNTLTFSFGGQYPSHTHSTMPSVTGTGVAKVVNGVFQSPASTIVNADVSASAAIDVSKLSGVVAKAGDTMTGKLNLPASTASNAPLNLGNGTLPTLPAIGDLFFDGALKYRDSTGTRLVAATNKFNQFSDWQSITLNNNTIPVLLVTQNGNGGGIKIVNPTGTGESLRIEDESPETTPFVVSATGKVGVGVTPDAAVALSVDTTGVKFGDGTIQTTAATGSGTVTSVTATSPITSSGGATPVISTSMASNKLLGRSTAATGVAEEISIGTGLSLSAGTLTSTVSGGTNIWIPASAWIPRTTTGCGVDSRELATNLTNYDELLFDPATNEFAQALTVLPNNYNNSTITGRFYWTASTGSGAVVWGLQGRTYADGDSLDQAFGTAQTVTDTLITTNSMHVTSATSAITIAGTPAANRPILLQIYRDATAGGDTLASDAQFLGVEILFN